MVVIATQGTRCPMEDTPRRYITDTEAVEVPDSAYYQRLVLDGSLQETTIPSAVQTPKTKEVKDDGK